VVKALCLGARAVLIGRAYAYGLGAAGGAGVTRAIAILRADILRTLTLLGVASTAALDASLVNVPTDWSGPAARPAAQGQPYDPLAISGPSKVQTIDLTITDPARHRDVPIRVYLPTGTAAAPVVLFSHGLGGSREDYAYLGEHWAARGYVAVFLQHHGSDTSVWIDKPPAQRMQAMQAAANRENFLLRVGDVVVAIDQLERWNAARGQALFARLDLKHIGMAGHSFGAVTTQAVSGERTTPAGATLTDARIRAAIAMSPSSPVNGTAAQIFGIVTLPWMLMTGTKDANPIGGADPASRLVVFPALPPGDKYEIVLNRAEHSAFSDGALPGDTEPRNPNHHRVILALSTAFWDAYLLDDGSAKAWLTGDGPRSVLDAKDRWQKK
jgi:dienelactone hydrolase